VSVAICTDSSALLPAGVADHLGVIVVPIAITLDGRSIGASAEDVDEFYSRLSEGAQATTSQPSPGEFLEAYARAQADGAEEVLSIHLDGRVSGTVRSAELAAREAPIPVSVVDARTVSYGVGVCVRAAAEAIATGARAADAAASARRVGATLRNVFTVHAAPRGRLPGTPGWLVLEFGDGKTKPLGSCDNIGDATGAMTARLYREDRPVHVAVGHAAASTEPAADALARSLETLPSVVDVERYRVGPAVGAHTGPTSFGAFWWPDPGNLLERAAAA
jgi:DegV family protein with EDD domain